MIEVRNLHKFFGVKHVLRGITETIQQGEKVVVVGPSGSGKSTFLRCLNLLEVPSSGEIYFEGNLITDKGTDINRMRQKMGMVFQNFNLFPHLSVLRNLTLAPIKLKHMPENQAIEKARYLLERVGLPEKADAYPSSLSGGQKQRIAIARALINNPSTIVADEPTGNLDPERSLEIMMLLERINQLGTTILVVTHERQLVNQFNKRVIYLEEGKIVSDQENGCYDI